MFPFRGIRHIGRSYSTTVLLLTTIITSLLTLHLYRKDKQRQETIEHISSSVHEQPQILSSSNIKIIDKPKQEVIQHITSTVTEQRQTSSSTTVKIIEKTIRTGRLISDNSDMTEKKKPNLFNKYFFL